MTFPDIALFLPVVEIIIAKSFLMFNEMDLEKDTAAPRTSSGVKIRN